MSRFVFVADKTGQVAAFRWTMTERLEWLGFSAASIGKETATVVHPTLPCAFVARVNDETGTVVRLAFGLDGRLARTEIAQTNHPLLGVVMHPSGRYLYAWAGYSDPDILGTVPPALNNDAYRWELRSNQTIKQLTNTKAGVLRNIQITDLSSLLSVFDPTGNFLFIYQSYSTAEYTSREMNVLRVLSDGRFAETSTYYKTLFLGSPPAPGQDFGPPIFDGAGRWAFMTGTGHRVVVRHYSGAGRIGKPAQTPYLPGQQKTDTYRSGWVTGVSPDGRLLYCADRNPVNEGRKAARLYAISSTGHITGPLQSLLNIELVPDPNGKWAYAMDTSDEPRLRVFAVNGARHSVREIQHLPLPPGMGNGTIFTVAARTQK